MRSSVNCDAHAGALSSMNVAIESRCCASRSEAAMQSMSCIVISIGSCTSTSSSPAASLAIRSSSPVIIRFSSSLHFGSRRSPARTFATSWLASVGVLRWNLGEPSFGRRGLGDPRVEPPVVEPLRESATDGLRDAFAGDDDICLLR